MKALKKLNLFMMYLKKLCMNNLIKPCHCTGLFCTWFAPHYTSIILYLSSDFLKNQPIRSRPRLRRNSLETEGPCWTGTALDSVYSGARDNETRCAEYGLIGVEQGGTGLISLEGGGAAWTGLDFDELCALRRSGRLIF